MGHVAPPPRPRSRASSCRRGHTDETTTTAGRSGNSPARQTRATTTLPERASTTSGQTETTRVAVSRAQPCVPPRGSPAAWPVPAPRHWPMRFADRTEPLRRPHRNRWPSCPPGSTPAAGPAPLGHPLRAGQDRKTRWLQSLADLEPDLVVNTGDNLSHPRGGAAAAGSTQAAAAVPRACSSPAPMTTTARAPKNPFTYFTGPSKLSARTRPALPFGELFGAFEDAGWIGPDQPQPVHGAGRRPPGLLRRRRSPPGPRRLRRFPAAGSAPARARHLRIGVAHAPYQRVLNYFTDGGAELILAGHTHGGQVCVPGYGALVSNCDLPTWRAKGLTDWEHNGRTVPMNVSAGIGTSRFAPVRFACRPEAVLLTLTPQRGQLRLLRAPPRAVSGLSARRCETGTRRRIRARGGLGLSGIRPAPPGADLSIRRGFMPAQTSLWSIPWTAVPALQPILPRLILGCLCATRRQPRGAGHPAGASRPGQHLPDPRRIAVRRCGGRPASSWAWASWKRCSLRCAASSSSPRPPPWKPACAPPSTGICRTCPSRSTTAGASGQLLSRAMSDLNLIRRWMAFGAIMLVVTALTVVIGVTVMFFTELAAGADLPGRRRADRRLRLPLPTASTGRSPGRARTRPATSPPPSRSPCTASAC